MGFLLALQERSLNYQGSFLRGPIHDAMYQTQISYLQGLSYQTSSFPIHSFTLISGNLVGSLIRKHKPAPILWTKIRQRSG